ncbi:MAG: GDP-mannose 4,6-dehydratase [Victivallales bacterium]|nr:GDP-mannose 4,6-dehydratase [Victivallales bacterium]
MHYLITGGAGFIGGHLAESLIAEGQTVTVIDDLSTGLMSNIAALESHPRFHFCREDIISSASLDDAAREADAIIHLAAAVGVELVVHDPVRTIMTNVHGTESVLNVAAKYRKRIMIASTSEVYGKSTRAQFAETDDLLIGSPFNSRWSYACSKLLDEFFVMAYFHQYRLPGTIVRFFNTVGPRQTGRYGMVIPRFVAAARHHEPLQVYGTGRQTRCFCHVADTIRAVKALILRDDTAGMVFNIGSTASISIEDLARKVIAQLGSNSPIVRIPYEQAYEKGFEDMLHRAPDTALIRKVIGWQPEKSLQEIIADVRESQDRTEDGE